MPATNQVKNRRLNAYPNVLPLDYVAKSLARLLPDKSVVRDFTVEQLLKYRELKLQYESQIEKEPSQFLVPNKGCQRDYMSCNNPRKRGRFMFAGNKTGKTTASCVILAEQMCGRPLWGLDHRNFDMPACPIYSRTPKRAVYYTEDFPSHEETIIPTYLTWCPKSEILTTIRAQSGNLSSIVHKNGSILYFRTYDQGFDKAEGKDYHFAFCDEPPPREIYTAIFRGLVALGGYFYIGATLLKEAWLFDELAHDFVAGFNGDMYENLWLNSETRDNFIATLTPEERLQRVYGKPLGLVGLIYPEFKDAHPVVIDLGDQTPWNQQTEQPYPVVMGVDPHERKPLHILWGYVLPNDSILFFDYMLVPPADFDSIFHALEQKELSHRRRTDILVIDPNRGQASQAGGTSWLEQFELHGYSVMLGNDDLTIGHSVTRQYIKTGNMRWTTDCRGAGGPIHQLSRYSWDDWSRQLRSKKDLKEKPREQYKDFPDICRYIAMAGLTFDLLNHLDSVIDMRQGRKLGFNDSSRKSRIYA